MKFRIYQEVDLVVGNQIYTVDAKDEKEALEKHNRGESEWERDELEVQSFQGSPLIEPDD